MSPSASLKRAVKIAALTVAFSAAGPAVAALASTGPTTSGNGSILGGNQVNAPISAPLNVCGNALALLGTALAGCEGGASVTGAGSGVGTTSGNHSILGGNQVNTPVSAPVNVCGNSVAALGTALSGCRGGATVSGSGGGTATTSGNGSIGGGNQVNAPISIPVNVCGNAIAVLGTAIAGCQGGAHVGTPPPPHHGTPPPCHHHHHGTPPPCHHHHHHGTPPPCHHHHSGTTVTSTTTPPTTTSTGSSSLPTTGADFLGLLGLAGGALVSGAGSILLVGRRGLVQGVLVATRRAASVLAR